MASFEKIAKPHNDILKGNFTLETYAANLGDVVKGQGPIEYRNANQFFGKTYRTEGLEALLQGVDRRLKGRGGDAVIQLQTPFGGGKTHTLIALYHKAREWKAKPVVIAGSGMDAKRPLWAEIEAQLTGEVQRFKGRVAPGGEEISALFRQSDAPVLLLMDEIAHYLARANAVSAGKSTLAEQTLTFVQSLTESAASAKNVAFIATLQSEGERYGEKTEALAARFEKVIGRVEQVRTPVTDTEIAKVIRKRLFVEEDFDKAEVRKVVRAFVNYVAEEKILPSGVQKSEYQERFMESYPFQPEVIDVLYQRWGGFPTFQRTRGVLRLLSSVVHRSLHKELPYITLADFDLREADIRGELLKHAGDVFNSIIANDITGSDAGAKSVDAGIGDTYKNLALGTRTATAIFLYSFTGGQERGALIDQVKRSAVHPDNPSAIIDAAINQLNAHLFYLRTENGKSYFDTQPNLTRIVQIRMQNIEAERVASRADAQLKRSFTSGTGTRMKTFIAPKNGMDIPDTPELKLIILRQRDDAFCQSLLEARGETPRVYRNTLFFLTPPEEGAKQLQAEVKNVLAYEDIQKDRGLNLSTSQTKEVADKLRQTGTTLEEAVRNDYRTLLIPARDGLRAEDLGLPAHGMNTPFDVKIYDMLRSREEVLETIGERIILRHYLREQETLETARLFHSSLRTPGEPRVLREAWIKGIRQGVQQGLFGIGEKMGDELIQRAFKQDPGTVTLGDNEVIIHPSLCKQIVPEPKPPQPKAVSPEAHEDIFEDPQPRQSVQLRFTVPSGKVSHMSQHVNALQSQFKNIRIELTTSDGEISEADYEKLKEDFLESGIEVEEV